MKVLTLQPKLERLVRQHLVEVRVMMRGECACIHCDVRKKVPDEGGLFSCSLDLDRLAHLRVVGIPVLLLLLLTVPVPEVHSSEPCHSRRACCRQRPAHTPARLRLCRLRRHESFRIPLVVHQVRAGHAGVVRALVILPGLSCVMLHLRSSLIHLLLMVLEVVQLPFGATASHTSFEALFEPLEEPRALCRLRTRDRRTRRVVRVLRVLKRADVLVPLYEPLDAVDVAVDEARALLKLGVNVREGCEDLVLVSHGAQPS